MKGERSCSVTLGYGLADWIGQMSEQGCTNIFAMVSTNNFATSKTLDGAKIMDR